MAEGPGMPTNGASAPAVPRPTLHLLECQQAQVVRTGSTCRAYAAPHAQSQVVLPLNRHLAAGMISLS